MSERHIAWTKAGHADVLSFTVENLRVRSDVAAAPGTPLEGTLVVSGLSVTLKVRSCKRQPGGEFVIEGRPVNLTREQRTMLESLVPADQPAR
jgi:hypothetical protein